MFHFLAMRFFLFSCLSVPYVILKITALLFLSHPPLLVHVKFLHDKIRILCLWETRTEVAAYSTYCILFSVISFHVPQY